VIVQAKIIIDDKKLEEVVTKVVIRRFNKIAKNVIKEKRRMIEYELSKAEFRREPV